MTRRRLNRVAIATSLQGGGKDPANLTFNDDGSLVDPFVGVMKKVG